MASIKLVAMLGVIVVMLAIAVIYQYRLADSLRQSFGELEAKNDELTATLAAVNDTKPIQASAPPGSRNATDIGALESNKNRNGTEDNNNKIVTGSANYYSSQSITAVAVRAVPQTDGFFQSVIYEGTVMGITVDIRDGGKGLILVYTSIPTGVDFQTAAKTAVKAAQYITSADLSKKDIIFSITSRGNDSGELEAVDGSSAGAAMTTLLVSELQNKKLNTDVLMT